ncbi:MAG TPA: hypothetical protein VL171_14075 [Verrucomicrobiae bacterium]|nr:hypothetical protein [Verrucomicrobiae bacterium]
MLKRKGQFIRSPVPGSTVRLAANQMNAYAAAFAAIRPEFDELRKMQRQVRTIPQTALRQTAGSPEAGGCIAADGIDWRVQAQLLELPKSGIFLCRHPTENKFAIIQQFPADTPYAKTNGQAEVLLRGVDPRQLVREYAGWAQHTLRFMASNLVTRARRVTFEQFPEHNPGRIVRAISERCLLAVGESWTMSESLRETNRQARGIRH